MLYSLDHQVRYCEVNQHFRLRLGSLVRLLHEATVEHCNLLGIDMKTQQLLGYAWAVRKIGLRLLRFPRHEEQVQIYTWISQTDRIRMQREFEIISEEERLASGSSEWVCIDLHRRTLSRNFPQIPGNVVLPRTIGVSKELHNHNHSLNVTSGNTLKLHVRETDLDTNGHVNNATYFDYLETLLVQKEGDVREPLELCMHFLKEITPKVPKITASIVASDNARYFKIYECDTVFAVGDTMIPEKVSSQVMF